MPSHSTDEQSGGTDNSQGHLDRKVTQGTRSNWGNRWLERFWSIQMTCEQQGRNLLDSHDPNARPLSPWYRWPVANLFLIIPILIFWPWTDTLEPLINSLIIIWRYDMIFRVAWSEIPRLPKVKEAWITENLSIGSKKTVWYHFLARNRTFILWSASNPAPCCTTSFVFIYFTLFNIYSVSRKKKFTF